MKQRVVICFASRIVLFSQGFYAYYNNNYYYVETLTKEAVKVSSAELLFPKKTHKDWKIIDPPIPESELVLILSLCHATKTNWF